MNSIRPAYRKALPWLPIAVGPILLFGIDLIRGRALFWGAPLLQFTPWHTAAKEIAFSGHFPLWNPWLGMGAPLLANYQSALLYPPNWILLATDVSWGQTLLVLLHLIWAGFGMALLARSIGLGAFAQAIAGLAYGMSGYLVARSGFLSINAAAAWLPWILFAAEGLSRKPRPRSVALLGLVLGLQWLSGHAQIAWYTLILAAAWVVYRARYSSGSAGKAVIALLAAGLLAFAIAAVQLIPTLEYVSVSNRAGDLAPEFALTYSFWPWRLFGLVAPDLYGNPRTADFWGYGNYWEDAIYVGLLPLLLAVGALFTKAIGRLKWFLLGIVAVALLLSLGSNTPIFTFLFEKVPTFSLFQAPTRWNLWLVASLSLLAGLGAEHWQVAEGRKLYWLRLGTAGAGAILVVATLIGLLETDIEPTFTRAIGVAGFWLAAGGILALLRTDPARAGWTAAALSVVVLDLFLAGRGLNPTLPAQFNSAPTALSEEVSGDHRLYMSQEVEREIKFNVAFRFDSFQPELDWQIVRESGLPNTPLMDRLASANNFDPLLPARYVAWMEQLERATPAQRDRLLPYMDVGWQASVQDSLPTSYDPVPAPVRAWIVPRADWVTSPAEAIRRATAPNFDPSREVLLEGDPRLEVGGLGVVMTLRDKGPNEVELAVEAPEGGWLVLADTWYPGWTAELDGRATESYPANGVMRSIWVPAGQHTVTFNYRPITVPIGLALTLVGLAAFAYLRRK
ncbi:MAG: YfhO family protein [Anaerolineales bacterium]